MAAESVHSSGAPKLEIIGSISCFLDFFFFGDSFVIRLFSQFTAMRRENDGGVKLSELPEKMSRLQHVGETLTERERAEFLRDAYQNLDCDVDFELFLRVIFVYFCKFLDSAKFSLV